jgi:3-methylfumaryl-CoA hydratase
LAISEEYDTVFREEVKAGEKSGIPRREEPPSDLPWRRTITAGPVALFRSSALTGNPHRIHYDRPYAMDVEGYPGLVVHGPFTQACLTNFMRD